MARRRVLSGLVVLALAVTGALVRAAPSAGATPGGSQGVGEARLVSSTQAGVTFDVTVPWDQLHVEPSGSGYVQVSMPGWLTTSRAGEPMLPCLSQVIGVPWGAALSVRVQPGRAHTVELAAPVLPVATQEVAWQPPTTGDDVPALPEPSLVVRADPLVYAGDGEYPGVLAEVSNDGVIRQQRVVGIAAYPVQYDPETQQLTVYESLRVEVNFQRPPTALLQAPAADSAVYEGLLQEQLLNYDSARQWRQVSTPDPSSKAKPIASERGSETLTDASASVVPWGPPEPGWRVKVREDGFYKLTYTETLAAGLPANTLDPRTFQLYYLGSEVAITVTGQADGQFNSTDSILFYGQAVSSKYTADNVYWLTYGHGTGLRMGTRDGTPSDAATPAYYPAERRMEKNVYYLHLAPGADDLERWGWDYIRPPTVRPIVTNTFTLTAPYTGTYPATLTVALLGFHADPVNPDHHAKISVNGTQVADAKWDGIAWQTVSVGISQTLLLAGSNVVSVACFTDTGASEDVVYLDWERLEYANTFRAEGDLLPFRYDVNGTWKYRVDGFSTNQVSVYDVTVPTATVQIEGISVASSGLGYAAQFQDTVTGTMSYWAVGNAAYRTVQGIEQQDTASNLRSTSNDAEHIIIYHKDFAAQAEQLRTFRVTQGITRSVAVDVQDVYDEFGYGLVGAEAIHDFVAYAYSNWKKPAPSYLVLVGDGHYDPKNYLGLDPARVSYIPPYLAYADPWLGETAVDNRYVTVAGGDTFPDLMLGRLAVNSSAEASAFVNKIVAYEQSPEPGVWKKQVLAVADNADTAGNFPLSSARVLSDCLPTGYQTQTVYLGVNYTDASVAHAAILAGINAGKLIVNYIGHAAQIPSFWADEDLFGAADVKDLTNGAKLPVMLPMTCYDGYYQFPYPSDWDTDALGEVVTRAAGKGAVASWSPTGLGMSLGHDYLDRGFFTSVFSGAHGHPTLGAATIAGKLNLWATGDNLDLIDTYLLFGDPAIQMPITAPSGALGDVNSDGYVDSTDGLIVLSADVGVNTAQFCPMNCGDVNGDGYVNSTDALIILSYDVGITVPFSIGQPGCPSSITQPPGCG